MGFEAGESSGQLKKIQDRPLYFWLKSFASREIEDDAELSSFVSSNALTYALEYIGITLDSEQLSSLHLSAIFDEDSPRSNKYPSHYETETKSKIKSLNRIFIEVKSLFEDRFSQLVAIRPPNSVHITSNCGQCSIIEFEKLLFLLLGAAIQGSQKQDTIRTIKKFPSKIQESLIECVKLIADNPELLTLKSWTEYQTLGIEEQKKIYENLIGVIRKLILERNELAQNQLIGDYFAGYTNCDQTRGYSCTFAEGQGQEDSRLTSSVRHLKEQLSEKSELLKECRDELERARNRILDLEIEVNEMKHQHRAVKKARDEIDALREGHEKAVRLESELTRLKARLEESEMVHERVESLEIENREWRVKHDMLLDQVSFLSFEKSSRSNSFDHLQDYDGILDGLLLKDDCKELKEEQEDADDDRKYFESDDEEHILNKDKHKPKVDTQVSTKISEPQEEDHGMNTSTSTIHPDSSPEKEVVLKHPLTLDLSETESIKSGENLVASTPKGTEFKSIRAQTPTNQPQKRKKVRTPLLNLRKKNAIIIPVPSDTVQVQDIENNKMVESSLNKGSSQTVQVYKVFTITRRKGSSRPKKFKPTCKSITTEKDLDPVHAPIILDNEGNEADEELSISPTGNSNLSDLDSNHDPLKGSDNDSEIYFVCKGDGTPKGFGTTTAFPISNGNLRRTEFAFNPQNLSEMHYKTYNGQHENGGTTTYVHNVPYTIPHLGHSSNSDGQEDDDASNAFTFGDYNIQLNLRNSIKPAYINKITTLSASNSPQPINQYSTAYAIETSSEEDGSIWYEYGCV